MPKRKLKRPNILTRSEITKQVSDKTGFIRADAHKIVNAVFQVMHDHLTKGPNDHRVEIRYFGTFKLRRRNERIGRNPKQPTQEITIPAHTFVSFTPATDMKLAVRNKVPPV